jgi:hypothetical protein
MRAVAPFIPAQLTPPDNPSRQGRCAREVEKMIYSATTREETPEGVQLAQCHCGEAAFVVTSEFVCWQRCVACSHHRVLAWSSYQTPTLILGGALRNAAA